MEKKSRAIWMSTDLGQLFGILSGGVITVAVGVLSSRGYRRCFHRIETSEPTEAERRIYLTIDKYA